MKNFITRTITALFFVVALVGGILYSAESMIVLFSLITLLSVLEFTHLTNQLVGVSVNRVITALGAVYLFLAFAAYSLHLVEGDIFIPYLFLLLYLFISELYLKKEEPTNNWAYGVMSQVYVALPFAVINLLAFRPTDTGEGVTIAYSPILPLLIFFFIWISDTGAYLVGSLFGKHRLFERISPKKSWEGTIGGGLCVILVAASLSFFEMFHFLSLLEWIGLALVVVVFGTWGDLVESLIKRQWGIKDSGNILPGHGGMLDRFDSALLAIPASVIYLYVIKFL